MSRSVNPEKKKKKKRERPVNLKKMKKERQKLERVGKEIWSSLISQIL